MYHYRFIAIGLLLLFFGCLQNEVTLVEQTKTIPENEILSWWFDAVKGNTIVINATVTNGGPIDIFFVDENGYVGYVNKLNGGVQGFTSIAHDVGITKYTREIIIDKPGKYYVVVDNTAVEGTSPTGSVIIKIKITKK
ncbi:MAG: hypothetical protein ABID61_06295 [Candidatus Micrarchaeota archaeon]